MCLVETMSLVGYKIGYIVNFVPNPDCHLDSKCHRRNQGWWAGTKKLCCALLTTLDNEGESLFWKQNFGENEDGSGSEFGQS